MTETVKAAQDETNKDSTHPSPSSKSSKVVKISSDGHDRPKQVDKTEKPPTKVVVRRLPPTMSLEIFIEQVSPLPPVDFMYFVKADSTLAPYSFCRAYLHFVHVDDMLIFTEKFDNYVFVDGKGNEFPAIVEYAPFQRIPKQRSSRKKDPRVGTIESDPFYQEFIEALKAEEAQRKSASKTNKQHFFETSASPSVQKVTTTPLLEFVKNRRADKLRSKEDRIAERRKREVEKRKAREEVRSTSKQIRSLDVDGDSPSVPIKIAGHGTGPEKILKEANESKRPVKVVGPEKIQKDANESKRPVKVVGPEKNQKDANDSKRPVKAVGSEKVQKDTNESKRPIKVVAPPARQERDRERKDKDLRKDSQKDHKKDVREMEPKPETESGRLNDSESNLNKSKENILVSPEQRPKDIRKAGKSYQEERQRLNERRLAAKAANSKSSSKDDDSRKASSKDDDSRKASSKDYDSRKASSKDDDSMKASSKDDDGRKASFKDDDGSNRNEKEDKSTTEDSSNKKMLLKNESEIDSRSQPHNKKMKGSDSARPQYPKDVKIEKKFNRYDGRKNSESYVEIVRKIQDDQNSKPAPPKEEVRKKSYNQEREQRRAADRKTQVMKDSMKTDDIKSTELKEFTSLKGDKTSDDSKENSGANDSDKHKGGGDGIENNSNSQDVSHEGSHKEIKTDSEDGDASSRKTNVKSKAEEKDKKDPRAERRIRNKDRPSIEIYRPGMGRFSRQRLEREKGLNKGSSTERDSPSSSPSPIPSAVKGTMSTEK